MLCCLENNGRGKSVHIQYRHNYKNSSDVRLAESMGEDPTDMTDQLHNVKGKEGGDEENWGCKD